jgi:tetratricopeptide (TPR) repeat protein
MLEIVLIFAAAVERWDLTAREANRLQEAGQFLDAERLYRDAVGQALAIHPRCHAAAASLNNLAVVHYRLGRYAEALDSYRSAIGIWRGLGRTPDLAAAQANLAELLHAQGKDEEALAESMLALAERERSGIASSQPLLVHANILRGLVRHSEARRYLKEAAALARRETPPQEGFAWSSLANLELATGNFAEARDAARRAIRIWSETAAAHSVHTANARILLARALKAEDNPGAAEQELREALDTLTALLGRTNPRLIPPLADLAGLLERRGRRAAALQLLQEAEQIARESLGEHHPDYAALLLTIGDHHRRHDVAAAASYYERALERASFARGRNSPALAPYLNNLATVRFELGDRPAAEALFRQSLAMREAVLGPFHLDLTETLLNLAVVCLESGRAAEARPLAERTLAIRQHALGAGHPSMAPPLLLYAKVLAALGEAKHAKRMESAARAISATVPESRHSVDWRQLKTGLR